MVSRGASGWVVARAPGKVNLLLRVGPVRADGNHELRTVFQAVDLYEQVRARQLPAGSGILISAAGPGADQVPTDQGNVAYRAAAALAAHLGVSPDVELRITKAVPVAAGMAGGSADAAATLVACNELWGAGLTLAELLPIGAEVGADVPFCLLGGTAIGAGKGDLLEPVADSGMYYWVFATSATGLSTPAVFREHDRLRECPNALPAVAASRMDGSAGVATRSRNNGEPARAPAVATPSDQVDAALFRALAVGDVAGVGAHLTNDLAAAAIALRPELVEVMEAARAAGAPGVTVSGSGPTIAALASDANHAERIAAALARLPQVDRVITTTAPARGAHWV